MRPLSFLVIDDNADSRFLLVRTLLRKFPSATIHECVVIENALRFCEREPPAAIILHRTVELPGLAMLPQLRQLCPDTPILFVSSIDRQGAAAQAGATAFLLYDEWLRVGTVVAELLANSATREEPDKESASPV